MSFDRLAPHYRWMERLLAGEKLQRCRTAYLDKIPTPHSILLLGEGPGRLLAECLGRFPDARITCVDASAAMLRAAQRGMERAGLNVGRVRFIHCDLLRWQPNETFDLIATHFFLDCFPPETLRPAVGRLAAAAEARAHWLIADFQAAPQGWKRVRSRMILAVMYSFFRAATRLPARSLTAPDPFLREAGFRLRARQTAEWELLHTDWWEREK